MNRLFLLCVVVATALAFNSCLKSPDYPIEPQVNFVRMSGSQLQQGGFDSLEIVFGFKDGDGDIGIPPNDTVIGPNVFLTDSRTGFVEHYFKVPNIPQGEDLSGEITVKIGSPCCIYQNGIPCTPNVNEPRDTLRYIIQIKDRAGHLSNTAETAPIILRCD